MIAVWTMLAAGAVLLTVMVVFMVWSRRAGAGSSRDLLIFAAGVSGLAALLLIMGGLRMRCQPEVPIERVELTLTPTIGPTTHVTVLPGPTATHTPIPAVTPTSTPTPVPAEPIFMGVGYAHDTRLQHKRMAIHVIEIDLTTPGIEFLVTPGQPIAGRQLPARTTSQFLEEFGLQVAVNGDFFEPWHYESPDDYYPLSGDPVNVYGIAASRGVIYSNGDDGRAGSTLYISNQNVATFDTPVGDVYNAISGTRLIVDSGRVSERVLDNESIAPRTVVGLDQSGQTLYLIVVDGRQTEIGLGVSLEELAHIAIQYGAYNAINLDGGGSTALVIAGPDGQPQQLNSPIHAGAPGTERPVANHLGVYARPLSALP